MFCYQTIPWRSNANLDSAAHCSVTCGLCPSSNNPDQFLITTDGGRVILTYDWVMIDNNGDQVIDVMSNLRLKIIVE